MIYLITGQPGAGKTAFAITYCLDLQKAGRTIYAAGVPGLDYAATGFRPIEDVTRWYHAPAGAWPENRLTPAGVAVPPDYEGTEPYIPDGAVILLDECYADFPATNAGKAIPPHIEFMARHRHRGFDFVLISQGHGQLHSFLKPLVHEHTHVVEKFKGMCRLRRWPRIETNPDKARCDDSKPWKRPASVFKLYKSTTVDTKRHRLPMWAWWLMLALAVLGGLVYYMQHRWDARIDRYRGQDTSTAGSDRASDPTQGGVLAGALTGGPPPSLRQSDYAEWLTPRVPGHPWSAPAYDNFPVVSMPQVFCMSTAETCRCITEQGTRYHVEDATCRVIAREGTYNPFKPPQQSHTAQRADAGYSEPYRALRITPFPKAEPA
ncbi:zonular occludens toxin domain-containing protein [Coralloluteibacterium thermophilus]|uniref:Zonular occludens toxin domain-containing protein n=1 Tax=Coralloluteibacterium thermophilum TaxID=2707049 RepID=A0ABV9NP94_9GAMM